jgi:hypothetical protein
VRPGPRRTCQLCPNEHIPADATTFGPSIVIEHLYARDIVRGAASDGMTIEVL